MKRKTVLVNCEKISPMIRENGRSNASFSRMVGKYPSWYGEVLRGKNLPSPEEAAKMCVLLNVKPDEILVDQAGIDLVNGLLEQEREKSAKKERPADSETLSAAKKKLLEAVDGLPDEQLEKLLGLIEEAKKLL